MEVDLGEVRGKSGKMDVNKICDILEELIQTSFNVQVHMCTCMLTVLR